MVAYAAYLMKGGSSGDMKTMSEGARGGSMALQPREYAWYGTLRGDWNTGPGDAC